MSIGILVLILIGSMLLVFATGLPVAFSLTGVAMLLTWFLWGSGAWISVVSGAWLSMSSFIMIAIPLFILMGFILQRSGLAEAMYNSLFLWAGGLKGGLAIGTVVVCTLMAAMTGMLGAGLITAGLIALPAMHKRNYEKHIAYGTVMAGAGLSLLIPPSVSMLLYAGVANMSVGKLFAGGIIPGLILSFLYMSYIGIRCRLNPSLGPSLPPEERGTLWQKIVSLKDSFLAIILIIAVLGSIFTGVATPSEASAVGAFGAIVVAAIYRRLNWTVIKEACFGTAKIFGMVMWIVIGAKCFSHLFVAVGGMDLIQGAALAFAGNRWFVVIAMQLSLILLGMLVDDWVVIVLAAPIYTPVVVALGFDPLWFALLFLVNLQMALLTPPYGFALYYMRSIVPEESYGTIAISILPFFGMQAIGLAICMIFPQVILWLPNLLIH